MRDGADDPADHIDHQNEQCEADGQQMVAYPILQGLGRAIRDVGQQGPEAEQRLHLLLLCLRFSHGVHSFSSRFFRKS